MSQEKQNQSHKKISYCLKNTCWAAFKADLGLRLDVLV